MDEFGFKDFLWRLIFSVALVLLTFNPTGHSYYHWLADGFRPCSRSKSSRALRCLARGSSSCDPPWPHGTLGVVLLLALFGAIVWWVVSQGWLDVSNRSAMAWVVLLILGLVLGIGMSWSHIRREVSGQASVDRVDK